MRQHIVRIALGLGILLVLLGHAAKIYPLGFIDRLDAIIYDARLRLTMPKTLDERIVILDIDEKSLAEIGRWPWGRDLIGKTVTKLFDKYGVAVLGFDIVFAESDDSSGLKKLEALAAKQLRDVPQFQSALRELRPQLDNDQNFSRALSGRRAVLGYYFSSADDARESGMLPPPVLPAGTFKGKQIDFPSRFGFGANLPELQKNAASAGHFNPLTDFDGVNRRVPLISEYKGKYYDALSLAMVRTLLDFPKVVPGYPNDGFTVGNSYAGMEWIDLATPHGVLRMPVDESAAALIPYRGYQGSFKYISLADVIADRVKPEQLKGKIVLIGTTAPGLNDLRSTPVGEAYAGVEIHANLISGMLDGTLKKNPRYVTGAEIFLLFVTGIALALAMPLLNPLRATLLTLLVLAMVIASNILIWQAGNIVLPLASGILLILLLFALNMSYGYFVESRSKRQFTELFGQYVPPELVDEMSRNPESYSMEGKSEELTVMFSDVRGFTTISEGLSPKDLTQLMNEYLTAMTGVIQHHRGTLDKYIGDMIMAFWGAPVKDPEHARNAVLTALDMQRALEKLSAQFKARGWPEIKIGIGVNTGEMIVGDMGSVVRKAYTVMGDAVNLGSRLESITKQYGVGILVGEATQKLLKDIEFRELDRVRVKGKDEPVAIFEPLGRKGEVPQALLDEAKLFQQVLRLYRSQAWDLCEIQLLNLSKIAPDARLYKLYIERVAYYRANPPNKAWDGVTTFETK